MTLREVADLAAQHPWGLVAYFVVPPLLVVILPLLHGRGNGGRSPWKYLYSAAIFASTIPGTLAAVCLGYTIFLTSENALDVNLLVYGLPVVSMVATLGLGTRSVDFDRLPGFARLSGLVTLLALTFVVVLFVAKTRIWILFGGSLVALGVAAVVVFAALRWAGAALFGRGGGREPPRR